MRQAADPSVEDILESIKKVIARDNRAGAEAQRRQRASGGIAAPAPASEHDDEDDVLDLAVSAQFLDPLDDEGEGEAGDPALITPDARAAMRESLAALAMVAQPGAAPQIVRSGETSLEGLVREMLRPALAEWLDRNLPALVERMVAAEIAKIVGKKI